VSLTETISKHPVAIGLAVLAVALVAYFMSRGGASSADTGEVTFTGAGGTHATTDPGAVSIEQSRIQAGTQNLSTLATLLGGEHLADAQEQVSLNQSADALTASLANTNAALSSDLARTEAQKETSLAQTAASVSISAGQNAAAIEAAKVTSATQQALADAELKIAKLNADVENFRTQAQKDEARAADNTSIVDGVVRFGENIVRVFEPWTW
jgi:hypothetical protein